MARYTRGTSRTSGIKGGGMHDHTGGGAGRSSDAGSGSHHGTQAQERPSTAVLGLWVALNHLLLSRRTLRDAGAVEEDVERMKQNEEG